MFTLNTQLPLEWQQALMLPAMFTSQSHQSMFNKHWHMTLNWFSFISTTLAMLTCVWQGRFIMQPRASNSLGVKQFLAYLVYHGAFYIVELLVTNMCLQYTSMAYHHLIALIIFALFFTETNTLCVFSLLPFLLHASFWVFTDTSSLTVLFLYNWTFLLVGLISIAVWIVDSRRTSWRLPLLCVFEVACNTYNYCWDFRGKECPDTSFISTTNRKLGLAILVGCLSTILVLISTVLGLIAKRYYYGAEQGKGNIGKVVVNKMSSRRISTRSSTKHSGALLVKEE